MRAQHTGSPSEPTGTGSSSPSARGGVAPAGRPAVGTIVGNGIRGGLIGMAEMVPGVSGGTVALVTGVYPRLLESGAHVVDALKAVVTGPDRGVRAGRSLRAVDWWLLLPLMIGMVAVVFTLAGTLKGFVEGSPEIARGLFLGMVAASLVVPLRMARHSPGPGAVVTTLVFLAGAAVAFVLSGLPGGAQDDPPLPLVFGAAAIAVCALVLPGVSGSYLLLAMGLYSATLGAVDERDPAYLLVFAAGAFCGLALFVKVLDMLLERHRRTTLMVMAGLMLGSLRALWPWRTGDAEMLAPTDQWPTVLLAVLAGAAVVVVILGVEKALTGHLPGEDEEIPADWVTVAD